MHDAVLQTCTERLLEQGINCVRFNCRGVGASNGAYDKGFGESEDLLAIADWVSLHRLTHQQFWLGYSFGAAVVWRALQALRNAPPRKGNFTGTPPQVCWNLTINRRRHRSPLLPEIKTIS